MASSLLIPLLVIAPGVGATLAVFKPGQARLPLQLACFFGLGQATLIAWALLLAVLRILSPVAFYGGLAVVTVALWTAGLRRGGLGARWRELRHEIAGEPVLMTVSVVALLILSFALARGASQLTNLDRANPLRYWADGLEVADAGGVPAEVLQWGGLYVPAASKLGFNAFNGAFSYVTNNPLQAMAPLLAVGLVGATFAGWSLGRELGLRYTAPLLALLPGSGMLAFNHSLILSSQDWFSAETFARLTTVTGMALAVNSLHNPARPAVMVAAGVALGTAGTTHLVPTVIGIGLLGLYALFHLLVWRSIKQVATLALVVGSIFGSFLLSGFFLAGGDAAFNSVDKGEAIETRAGTFDPTRYFASGQANQTPDVQPKPRAEMNDGWYELPGAMFDRYVSNSISMPVSGATTYIVFFGIGVLCIGLFFVSPKGLRPIPPAGFALWGGVLLVSLFMSHTYETYVPAAFAPRRLWTYDTFMLVMVGLVGAEIAFLHLDRVQKWIPAAVSSLMMIGTLALAPPHSTDRIQLEQGAESLRAINWISENVPCDARILANQRTGGTFQALTGRVAVTEGMAPYLRPRMLEDVTELLLEARGFFASPIEKRYVLDKYGIDHIVVAKERYLLDRTPALMGRPRPALVGRLPELERIHMSRSMDVYRVPRADTSKWPQPADHVGRDCRTEPLDIPTVPS